MADFGSALGLVGDTLSFVGGLEKGDRPIYQPVDLSQATGKTIESNIANLPKAQQLAAGANVFNQQQVLAMLKTAIPDYEKIAGAQSSVIQSQLAGELPEGVKQQLQDSAAAYGITSGTKGSQFAGYRGLRNLGIESLQYTQAGLSNADRYLRTSKALTAAPVMDVSSMFVSPTFGDQFQAQQHQLEYQSQVQQWGDPNALQQAGNYVSGMGGFMSGSGFMNMFSGLGGGGGGKQFSGYNSSQMPNPGGLGWSQISIPAD